MTSPTTPTVPAFVIDVGTLTLRVTKLRMGQLRKNPELHGAVTALVTTAAGRLKAGQLPSPAEIDTMITIAAAASDTSVDVIARALDEMAYDEGFLALANCCKYAVYSGTPGARVPTGEAEAPSTSMSGASVAG
jgi:hypothetical protein